MPIMVVRVVDKVNPDDPQSDAWCSKRGDVIDLMPDGWAPRPGEQAMIDAGQYVLVTVDGATIDDLTAFLAHDDGDPVAGLLARRRAFGFDVDQWNAQGRGRLPLARALAHKVLKARLKDPRVKP